MDKSLLMAEVMRDLSQRFPSVHAEAERDALRSEGAARALIEVARCVLALDSTTPLARVVGLLHDHARQARKQQLIAQGHVEGLRALLAGTGHPGPTLKQERTETATPSEAKPREASPAAEG